MLTVTMDFPSKFLKLRKANNRRIADASIKKIQFQIPVETATRKCLQTLTL